MAKKFFFSPSNAVIIGVAQGEHGTKFHTLNDIAQMTFSTPADTKPVFQFGAKEQTGYSYGSRVYAGTMTVPANAFPSVFELFEEWLQLRNEGRVIVPFNAEDLPLFDIMIVSIPEYVDRTQNSVNTFLWTIYGVKIVETSVELSVIAPEGQIMLYRFTANAQRQQLVNLQSSNGEIVIPSDSLYQPLIKERPENSFIKLKLQQLYKLQ